MKRGFTLVELLAVIVIISLLSLITISVVSNIVEDGKEEMNEKQIIFLQKNAQLWGVDNIEVLPSAETTCEYITLKNLKDNGYIDENAIDLYSMQKLSDDIKVAIRPSVSDGKVVYSYEVNSTNLNNCEYLYEKLKYTVSFNTMGGTEIASIRVEPGKKASRPSDPKKHEYKFREWTLDNATYDFNTPVNSDITLVAEYDTTELYTLMTGKNFNKTLKNLAHNSTTYTYNTYDYLVEHIEFYSNGELPTGFTLTQLQALPSKVVSLTGETIKAYYNSNNKTIYVYSDGEIVWNDDSSYMFSLFRYLQSFEIPYNLTSIGNYVFDECSKLTSITIPNSVTSIGSYAFDYSGLTSITISNSVTSIGSSAFNHTKLTSILIPSSVTSIGTAAFGNSSLTSITVDPNNTVYEDRNSNAIIKKSTNELIAGCKNTVIPSSVTSIGSYAFYNSGLTSITIPSSVTSIGSYAFYNSSLTSITIPSSVASIGSYAFNYCSNLTSITIPSSVTSIGSYAFSSTKLTSIAIPSSVTSIGTAVFSSSTLASITVDPNNTVYEDRNSNAIIKKSTNELIAGCKNTVIPSSVTSIGSNAFYNSGLTTITIPNSVTSIGSSAFYSSSLTSITIPSSVTSIGSYAFYNSGLTSITIPGSVTSIGNYAFYGCSKLTSITFAEPTGWWRTTSSTATSGTSIDLSNASQNVTYFKSDYYNQYFRRTVE